MLIRLHIPITLFREMKPGKLMSIFHEEMVATRRDAPSTKASGVEAAAADEAFLPAAGFALAAIRDEEENWQQH